MTDITTPIPSLTSLFGTRFSFYAIAALIVLLVVGYGYHRWRVETLSAQLTTASATLVEQQGVNRQNAQAMQAMQEQHARDIAALAAATAADLARAAESSTLHEEINHAKPSDDGPIAIVLSRTLDVLRGKSPPPGAIRHGKAANPAPAP